MIERIPIINGNIEKVVDSWKITENLYWKPLSYHDLKNF